jgi:SH3-like domain-containing protein
MQVNLLSDARTAMVKGTILSMRDAPRFNARVTWRAAPGVVGRISRCSGGWCYFDVHGRGGYVEISHIWGADPNEVLN